MAELPSRLAALTQARIGLPRAGHALNTAATLAFDLAHARARDAVHAVFDAGALHAAFGAIEVRSAAPDRATYLQRPDLGRQLPATEAARLAPTGANTAIVVGDGLSATAVALHAVPLIEALRPRLGGVWAPIVAAHQARVALGDAIGAALAVDVVVMLIGERPGLSAPDSLGAYITWQPRPGRQDSERNCVSNIRPPHGLDYETAATRIAWLVHQARARRLTGVALKDESTFTPRLG
ncbi:ethanolamine ammonia-lyase subunit EutC [Sandarakinorhabdus sp.]|uniref:ethanolamine ammonia-lyase subunit EutC n=1 Tax=Sandarakinorhabdus sp. TaxID=1916663 RepID=UPI003F72EA0D